MTKRKPPLEPTYDAPRAHPEGHALVVPALNRAVALVGIVREADANAVARIIDPLDWEQLAAVLVVLAAMVPDDRTVPELTAWVHERAVPPVGLRSVS
jgi:hypothetical protein